MADKIKKFFQKKKVEAKFKLAGPGHKLSEASLSTESSASSKRSPPLAKRSGLSQEAKVAADAALARLQQKTENPAFNTSLAAIQAQVRKELENEKASTSLTAPPARPTAELGSKETVVEDLPKNYAVDGVYFRCPLISNEVLPRDEWKRNIKQFLYDQLEEERGLTACLIIHCCNNNREKVEVCVDTLCKYLENIVTHPDDDKYQKIRLSNRAFMERVQPIEGAMELLHAAGFTQRQITNSDGVQEAYLVFDKALVPSVEFLTTLMDALRTAEPIQLELDRNLQVLLPSQAHNVNLPPSFYALSSEELKREQQLRSEALEKSQSLRTKAMRERDELREMRRYKFAIIRVRFPDGVLLQGTFSVYERYSDIHSFVADNIEHTDLPFVLNTPTGHKLHSDEDGDKTLVDLRMVPATVLTFAWDPSVAEAIRQSPNKDVYLKPEVMVLVREV